MNSRFWLLTTPWRPRYYLVHIKDGLDSHDDLALFPGAEEGEKKEHLVHTVCVGTSSPQNYVVTVFVRICMYTGDVINLHSVDVPVGHLFDWVLYHAVIDLIVVEHLKIKLKKEQVASNECVYQGNIPLWVIHQFSKVNYYHCLLDISLCIRQYKTI